MRKKISGFARRKIRVRSKIYGTSVVPRLSVSRSNRFIYAQLIDDSKGKTLAWASEKELEDKTGKLKKGQRASLVGKLIAEKSIKHKVKTAIFDRSGYKYQGRVKALAEAAREAGLKL